MSTPANTQADSGDTLLTVLPDAAQPAAAPRWWARLLPPRSELFPFSDSPWFARAVRSTALARLLLVTGGAVLEVYFAWTVAGPRPGAPLWPLAVGYWLFAVIALVLAYRAQQSRIAQAAVGLVVDIVAAVMLHTLASRATAGNALLLVWPVLEAGVLGSGYLAVLVALVQACYLSTLAVVQSAGLFGDQPSVLYAVLTSVGLLAVGLLTQQLTLRLHAQEEAREAAEQAALRYEAVNRLALAELDEGVFVASRSGKIETANPAALRMLGLKERALPTALHSRADLSALAEAFDRAVAMRSDAEQRVQWQRKGVQHDAFVQCRLTRAAGQDAVVVFLRDAKRVDAQVQEAKLAAMGRLVAGIAHDIRNPLSAISQAAELLREQAEAGQARLPAMITTNVARINETVEDVLLLGRRSRGPAPSLDLHPWLEEWADERRQQSHPTTLRLILPPVDIRMRFHPDHLRRILNNLYDNALRYCSDRPGAVQLSTRLIDDSAQIGLANDGPLIEPAVRAQLFEPFMSGESRGTGLGLYLCRELCAQNGAQLEYQEIAGGHGEFVITAPLARTETAALV
jgi:two-component system sensor histidine kinase PilS (NtrC family)